MRALPIDPDYLHEQLLALLAIPSPSGYTDEVVQHVAAELERMGVACERTRRGALRARLPGPTEGPCRAVAAHVDTLGAMVRELRDDGRLGVAPVGTWPARAAEGGRVTVLSHGRSFRGTVLPAKASGHVYGQGVDAQPAGWDHLRLRVDARAEDDAQLAELGIQIGDFVAFDPDPEHTDAGYVVSRFLDDKAGVAALLAAVRAITEAELELPVPAHALFTITEEVGSGASAILPPEAAELVGIDNATPAESQASSETEVTVPLMDSSGPFDRHLAGALLDLAARHDVPVVRDVFRYYRSDAASAVEAGHDVRTALLTFGVDASHHRERTHMDCLLALAKLVTLYLQRDLV